MERLEHLGHLQNFPADKTIGLSFDARLPIVPPNLDGTVVNVDNRALLARRKPFYSVSDLYIVDRHFVVAPYHNTSVHNFPGDVKYIIPRSNLARHAQSFPKPWEINLGFNAEEQDRADDFVDRNERPWCHWRFPLIERGITRAMTVPIVREAGLQIIVEMYRKMGRFDCFFCGNQKPEQALKVVDHYPMLAKEWIQIEERKGHSMMPIPLKVLIENRDRQGVLQFGESKCACFGGTEDMFEDCA